MKRVLLFCGIFSVMGVFALSASQAAGPTPPKTPAVVAAAPTPAPAAETPPAKTVAAALGVPGIPKFGFAFAWAYYGPAVTSPFNSQQPDRKTARIDPGSLVSMEERFTATYLLRPTTQIALSESTATTPVRGMEHTLGDLFLQIGELDLIDWGGPKTSFFLRGYAPVSDKQRQRNQIATVRFTEVTVYSIPDSKFSLGFAAYAQGSFYGSQAPGQYEGGQAKILLNPGVEYAISPTVAASVDYIMYWAAVRDKAFPENTFSQNLRTQPSEIEPGVSWDVLPWLKLNPWLNINATENPAYFDNVTWNFAMTVKLI